MIGQFRLKKIAVHLEVLSSSSQRVTELASAAPRSYGAL